LFRTSPRRARRTTKEAKEGKEAQESYDAKEGKEASQAKEVSEDKESKKPRKPRKPRKLLKLRTREAEEAKEAKEARKAGVPDGRFRTPMEEPRSPEGQGPWQSKILRGNCPCCVKLVLGFLAGLPPWGSPGQPVQDPHRLPCNHVFCRQCIARLGAQQQLCCPLCRTTAAPNAASRAKDVTNLVRLSAPQTCTCSTCVADAKSRSS